MPATTDGRRRTRNGLRPHDKRDGAAESAAPTIIILIDDAAAPLPPEQLDAAVAELLLATGEGDGRAREGGAR